MGPRRDRRGELNAEIAARSVNGLLQWGRVVIDAESWRERPPRRGGPCLLQWGRVVIDAESSPQQG